jgi:hypothetical protein
MLAGSTKFVVALRSVVELLVVTLLRSQLIQVHFRAAAVLDILA